jgi:hypothetical protein
MIAAEAAENAKLVTLAITIVRLTTAKTVILAPVVQLYAGGEVATLNKYCTPPLKSGVFCFKLALAKRPTLL